MSTDKPTKIVSFSQTYPPELAAMIPPQFNAPDNILPVDSSYDTGYAFDPDDINKKDLWQQRLIQLKDIPVERWWQSSGKMLMIPRLGQPTEGGYNIDFGYPDQLETPRSFSISGDGTAEAVLFDGTADVNLVLTDVTADGLKTARDFSIAGDIVATAVSFDGSANVVLQTSYNDVVPDQFLPEWIADSFTAVNTRITNIENSISGFANKTVVISSAGSFTLNAGHKDRYIRLPSGTVSVPPGVFVKDDVVYIRSTSGAVTIASGVGVTVNRPYGQDNVLPGAGATVALVCIASNQFDLIGTTRYV